MYFYSPPAIFQFMFVSQLLFEFLCRLIKISKPKPMGFVSWHPACLKFSSGICEVQEEGFLVHFIFLFPIMKHLSEYENVPVKTCFSASITCGIGISNNIIILLAEPSHQLL